VIKVELIDAIFFLSTYKKESRTCKHIRISTFRIMDKTDLTSLIINYFLCKLFNFYQKINSLFGKIIHFPT